MMVFPMSLAESILVVEPEAPITFFLLNGFIDSLSISSEGPSMLMNEQNLNRYVLIPCLHHLSVLEFSH